MRFTPLTPDRLVAELVERVLAQTSGDHPVRVGLDGPRCARLDQLAEALGPAFERIGHPVAVVRGADFYRDASLRYEYGKTDVESFYTGWLDHRSLQAEVLTSVVDRRGEYLPSLRDPVTNRSTHAAPLVLPSAGVLIVVGELLLGVGLDFDLTVHASVSRQARRRQTEPDWQWTLPAFDRYDLDVGPEAVADVVFRYDDPQRPALAVSQP